MTADSPRGLGRLLRDPLVHFLLLGAVLFLVAPRGAPEAGSREIVVTPGRVEQLAETFRGTWQRPPSAEELAHLVDDHVAEEILYREALQMGLDQEDVVIRRRLRQKMEFFSEDLAMQAEPTDEELAAWLAAHPDDYQRDPRLSFEHVYVNADQRGADAADAEASRLLARLRAAPAGADPGSLGDRIGLQPAYDDLPATDVATLFGAGFVPPLLEAPIGEWTGPVESGFGLHLVRVRAREPGVVPPLAEVRDLVRRDVLRDRRLRVNDEVLARLRERYVVQVEWPAWAQPAAGLAQ